MRNSVLVVALVVFLVGLLFFGQGMGVIPGSAMTGSRFWAVVGAVMVVAAGALVAREWGKRSTRRGG